jgi:hypothetical protein
MFGIPLYAETNLLLYYNKKSIHTTVSNVHVNMLKTVGNNVC